MPDTSPLDAPDVPARTKTLRFGLRPPAEEERREIEAAILDGAYPTRRFYVLLTLSTTIAALGLLANSAAVIIGAMIVAPLMGPILGLALGMVSADYRLERRSLLAEATGVGLALVIGYVIGLIPVSMGVTSEMLARTSPTTYDIGIAFASGLAAGYASVNRKVNSALAGVAISVALVPPLTTSGLLLAMGEPGKSFGAFLLFLANFFCIQMAAALVFLGFRLQRPEAVVGMGIWRYRLRFAPSLLGVAVMSWFMTGTLTRAIEDHNLEAKLTNVLSEQIARRTGGQLDQILQRSSVDGGYLVVASALTPKVFDTEQVRQIEQILRTRVRGDISLVLRSVVSQDMSHSGRVYLTESEEAQAVQMRDAARFLDLARTTLTEELTSHRGATLDSLERIDQEDQIVMVAVVRAPDPLSAEAVAGMEEALSEALQSPLRLVVRNVVTQVVDRSGNLYTPAPEVNAAPDPAETALKVRIEKALAQRIAAKPARQLRSLELQGTTASAIVEATQAVRPEEVAAIEKELRRFVDPRIRLLVRTELAATAGADGWKAGPP